MYSDGTIKLFSLSPCAIESIFNYDEINKKKYTLNFMHEHFTENFFISENYVESIKTGKMILRWRKINTNINIIISN